MNIAIFALMVLITLVGISYPLWSGRVVRSTPARSASARACVNCGHPLAQDDRFCPQCGTPVSLRCARCGRPLAGDEAYCPGCGTKVSREGR